MTNLHFT